MNSNDSNTSFNRRQFMAATGGASIYVLRRPGKSAKFRRAGISNEAYAAARKRAQELVARMTLDEKIRQTGNVAAAIPRLNIAAHHYWNEALHGLANGQWGTSFPQPLALAGSWNLELALQVYTAISDEARATHRKSGLNLTFFSPQTLNLHRDPRWGRCEEAPGEDPYFASRWVVQVCRGMQGNNADYLKTAICGKHFICNNTEDDRFSVSATVDPRSFWEYYTRAYETAVEEGDIATFMGAFNAINGIPCCADHTLLTDLLRRRWGFRGYVISDCGAVEDICTRHHYVKTPAAAAAAAINAGCDLTCGNDPWKQLAQAVTLGLVSEGTISEAVTRAFTVRALLGEFDAPESVPFNHISMAVINSPKHQALALQAARESIILLKNQNNLLPLNRNKLKRVAVIGPMADQCHRGGYSGGCWIHVSPLQGIARALGIDAADAFIEPSQVAAHSAGVEVQIDGMGHRCIGNLGNDSWVEYEPQNFTGVKEIMIRAESSTNGGTVRIMPDSLDAPPIATLHVPHTGQWMAWRDFTAPLHTAMTGSHRMFLRFTGTKGPVMKLQSIRLRPAQAIKPSAPGATECVFAPGCTIAGPKDQKMFDAAIAAARGADVVFLVCGVSQDIDMEGRDRKDTQLPGAQHELIQAIHAVNPRTVLILASNNTVAVNWEQAHVPAIIAALYAGQAQGTAIADVVFGDFNPSGKTCCTWYKSVDQLPPFHDYDIRKGRTYMYFTGQALYPFGYGLSYTQYRYSDLTISRRKLASRGTIAVGVTITNIGKHAGSEIVQMYVTCPTSSVKRPIKQLVGFSRVALRPSESKTVRMALSHGDKALRYWDVKRNRWSLQAGKLLITVGRSSASSDLSAEVELTA
jgi:beta-glucosidase